MHKPISFFIAATLGILGFYSTVTSATEIELYGRANPSIQFFDNGVTTVTEMVGNASNIGLKGNLGSNDPSDSRAIYQIEYQIKFDDAGTNGDIFTQRNSFIGYAGQFGGVHAGNHDTPFKVSQGSVDLFNDIAGDIGAIILGDIRARNSFWYKSASHHGFQGTIAFIAASESKGKDGVSANITYKNDSGLYLAAAIDNQVGKTQSSGSLYDGIRLVAAYSVSHWNIGLIHDVSEEVFNFDDTTGQPVSINGESLDGTIASVSYNTGPWTLKFQAGSSDIKSRGGELLVVGADYSLGAKTKLFLFHSQVEDDSGTDDTITGIGIQHNFSSKSGI